MVTQKRALARRVEENLLSEIPELQEFIGSQAELLEVGMGVLRDGEEIDGLWPFHFSEFCELVRKSPKGRRACKDSDKRACALCQARPSRESLEDYSLFQCHMGLIDLPSPIIVRGEIREHLFMGQMRLEDLDVSSRSALEKRFDELSLNSAGVDFNDLVDAYDGLKVRTLREVRYVDKSLCKLADAISVVAESFNTLREINELSSDLAPLVEMGSGLSHVYRAASRLLKADSGSLWLAHRKNSSSPGFGYATVLRPQEMHWFGEAENSELQKSLCLEVGEGIAGWIAQHRLTRRCNSVSEIEEVPAANPEYRRRRGLRSLIGAPIMSQGSLLGVLEVGSRKPRAFGRGHEQLIEILARIAANFVRRTKERELIVNMHAQNSAEELFGFLEQELPPLFGALAASVFRRTRSDGRLVLVPAFPGTMVRGLGPGATSNDWKYDVETEEGFTGWVGKYRIGIRVAHCRDRGEIQRLYDSGRLKDRSGKRPPRPPQWSGKMRAKTEGGGRHKDRPLMIWPVVDSADELLGVVRVCEREGLDFTDADEAFLRNICEQLAICMERLSRQQMIARQETARLMTECAHDFGRSIESALEAIREAKRIIKEGCVAEGPLESMGEPASVTELPNGTACLKSGKLAVLDLMGALETAERQAVELRTHMDRIVAPMRPGTSLSVSGHEQMSIAKSVREVVEAKKNEECKLAPVPVDLELDCDPACESLHMGDGDRLKKCLGNVIVNSIKAICRAERQVGKIRVQLRATSFGWVHLLVTDNGDGFGEIAKLIMDGRVVPADKRFGLGISLQECRDYVVNTLGGEFDLYDSDDGGANVDWVFPMKQAGTEDE